MNFKTLEDYLQDYIDNDLSEDLSKVTPAQRLGFIEKYMEFIQAKQLRKDTKAPTGDTAFKLIEANGKNG